MTRIVAGTARGRTLKVPSQGTRPTSAKVREALFSKLEHWNLIGGAAILDLFAGSGALGLEALSRGAASAVFVDQSRQAIQAVKANANALGLWDRASISAKDASQYTRSTAESFDLIFVDPPYAFSEEGLLSLLEGLAGKLRSGGMIVVERDARSPQPGLPEGLILEDHREWGDTAAWFIGPGTVSP